MIQHIINSRYGIDFAFLIRCGEHIGNLVRNCIQIDLRLNKNLILFSINFSHFRKLDNTISDFSLQAVICNLSTSCFWIPSGLIIKIRIAIGITVSA